MSGAFGMRLEDVEARARGIVEDLGDAEVAFVQLHALYWDVLVTIAHEQCDDAPPKEFAAAVIGAELAVYETFGSTPDHLHRLRQRLEGRPADVEDQTPLAGSELPRTKQPKTAKKKQGK